MKTFEDIIQSLKSKTVVSFNLWHDFPNENFRRNSFAKYIMPWCQFGWFHVETRYFESDCRQYMDIFLEALQQNTQLETLDFYYPFHAFDPRAWNSEHDTQQIDKMADALVTLLKQNKLKSLNLFPNLIMLISDKAFLNLMDAIAKNTSLQSLGLQRNLRTKPELEHRLEHLGKVLLAHPRLNALNLEDNSNLLLASMKWRENVVEFSEPWVQFLTKVLGNAKWKKLDLSTFFTDLVHSHNFSLLLDTVEANPNLRDIYFRCINFSEGLRTSEDNYRRLASFFRKPSLNRVNLGSGFFTLCTAKPPGIDRSLALHLLAALTRNKSIKQLSLCYPVGLSEDNKQIQWTDESFENFIQFLSKMTSLEVLRLYNVLPSLEASGLHKNKIQKLHKVLVGLTQNHHLKTVVFEKDFKDKKAAVVSPTVSAPTMLLPSYAAILNHPEPSAPPAEVSELPEPTARPEELSERTEPSAPPAPLEFASALFNSDKPLELEIEHPESDVEFYIDQPLPDRYFPKIYPSLDQEEVVEKPLLKSPKKSSRKTVLMD